MFAGIMELIGGALLFIPQLALLGAMVTFADSVQIFTLNMTYDVPVKLFSFHLILMSLVLIAPDAPRIVNLLMFNRTAEPSPQPALFRRRYLVLVALALQLGYGGSFFWTPTPARTSRGTSAAAARRGRRSTASGTSRR